MGTYEYGAKTPFTDILLTKKCEKGLFPHLFMCERCESTLVCVPVSPSYMCVCSAEYEELWKIDGKKEKNGIFLSLLRLSNLLCSKIIVSAVLPVLKTRT